MYRYILETIIDFWSTYLYSVTDIVVTSADILKDINDPDPENGERENKPVVPFFTADGKHISSISNGIIRATKNRFRAVLSPRRCALF